MSDRSAGREADRARASHNGNLFRLKKYFLFNFTAIKSTRFGFFQISGGVSQVEIDSIFIAENLVRHFLGILNFLLPNWVF